MIKRWQITTKTPISLKCLDGEARKDEQRGLAQNEFYVYASTEKGARETFLTYCYKHNRKTEIAGVQEAGEFQTNLIENRIAPGA